MAFWQNRSISLVDMYIDNTDSADNVGQINFSLEYDFENMTLILRIIQVRIYNLNSPIFKGFSVPGESPNLLVLSQHNMAFPVLQFGDNTLHPHKVKVLSRCLLKILLHEHPSFHGPFVVGLVVRQ